MREKYTKKFTKTWSLDDWEYRWEILGAHGGAHLSIRPYKTSSGVVEHSAGLEMHYRRPPKYMGDCAPSYARCFLLEAPCWHDGTSMYAQDFFVPLFLARAEDLIFSGMIHWCDERLKDAELT
jgi:hypothetical protein